MLHDKSSGFAIFMAWSDFFLEIPLVDTTHVPFTSIFTLEITESFLFLNTSRVIA